MFDYLFSDIRRVRVKDPGEEIGGEGRSFLFFMAVQDLRSYMTFLLCYICVFTLVVPRIKIQAGAQGVGVNYGMLGDNLPSATYVVALYKSRHVHKVRLFDPNPDALHALMGSGIDVILGTRNEDLQGLGSSQTFAANWVNTNVSPYIPGISFSYLSVGNEVIPSDLAAHVLPAMQNLDTALRSIGISIPVTTAISTQALGASFPPSTGAFSDATRANMVPIINFLSARGAPLLFNVYPYFAYAGNTNTVRLDYALFTAPEVVVQDGSLGYMNLFDAMVDGIYSALEKVGGSNVRIVVSETGWPSAGNGDATTIANAQSYNNNLIAHVTSGQGTPKRPGDDIETYLFAMFNENLKPAGTEQNFGLYHPDMTEVYHVNFSP